MGSKTRDQLSVDNVDPDQAASEVFDYRSSMVWEDFMMSRKGLRPPLVRAAISRVATRLAEWQRDGNHERESFFLFPGYLHLEEAAQLPIYAAFFFVTLLADEPSDAELAERWPRALDALFGLLHLGPSGGQRERQTIRGVAQVPYLVTAVQAVAVGCEDTTPDDPLLAVLCAEGSDESIDALLPHFHRAAQNVSAEPSIRLLGLRKYANPQNKALQLLFDDLQRKVTAQIASP